MTHHWCTVNVLWPDVCYNNHVVKNWWICHWKKSKAFPWWQLMYHMTCRKSIVLEEFWFWDVACDTEADLSIKDTKCSERMKIKMSSRSWDSLNNTEDPSAASVPTAASHKVVQIYCILSKRDEGAEKASSWKPCLKTAPHPRISLWSRLSNLTTLKSMKAIHRKLLASFRQQIPAIFFHRVIYLAHDRGQIMEKSLSFEWLEHICRWLLEQSYQISAVESCKATLGDCFYQSTQHRKQQKLLHYLTVKLEVKKSGCPWRAFADLTSCSVFHCKTRFNIWWDFSAQPCLWLILWQPVNHECDRQDSVGGHEGCWAVHAAANSVGIDPVPADPCPKISCL